MKPTHCFLIIFCCLLSCTDNKQKNIAKLVKEWQGREILFPKNPVFTVLAKDTIEYSIPQDDYKILVYVDSTGCTGCKLKLSQWKEFMVAVDSISERKISILFFLHHRDVEEMHYTLLVEDFNHPICIDVDEELNKLNRFPSDNYFQTFLLDKNNKVILMGNPVYNPVVKELYIKHIKNSVAIV